MDKEKEKEKCPPITSSDTDKDILVDSMKFKKMVFLYNALDNGWSIKKKENAYYFTKNHEGKKEVFEDSYLSSFMKENTNINNILF